jgi:hypothetical protein
MGGALTGDYVSLKGYNRCMILVHIAQGNASGGAITVDKATDVAGTGISAGITMKNIRKLEDYVMGTTASTALVAVAAAATLATSATGSGESLYVIDVAAEDLNGASAFDCLKVNLALSNAGNLASAMYVLYEPRYAGVGAQQIEAVTD